MRVVKLVALAVLLAACRQFNAPRVDPGGGPIVDAGVALDAECDTACNGDERPALWINEIHYDNAGADEDEGVEIAGVAGVDLASYQLLVYNGNDGLLLDSLTLAGVLPDQAGGGGTLFFSLVVPNGSPEGIALMAPGGSIVQFSSYEGAFTANDGPALGAVSVDIGVSEPSTTPIGQSLQLSGTGCDPGDFTWEGPIAQTRDTINGNQTLTCQ